MLIGSIYMYAGNTAPTGFILCDGSTVSRTTYAALFDEIGTTYGVGDGVSTFNVPDLRGKVIIGTSASHKLGDTGGEETHVLISGEVPVHGHSIPSHGHNNTISATTPKLSHSITQPAFTYSTPNKKNQNVPAYGNAGGFSSVTSTNATRSANLAISNHDAVVCSKTGGINDCAAFNTSGTGDGNEHSNMQPYISINHIIYAGV